MGLAVLFGNLDCDGGTGGGKLGRVVQQVVAHLGDRVRVAPYHQLVLRHLDLYVQLPVGNFGLQADEHPGHDLGEVKRLLGCDGALRQGVEPAEVQHPPHQAAQAPGLRYHDLKGLPLPLRRDGPVQNTLGKPGDGSHGGFQLVGDIGDELRALAFHLLQGVGHRVECLRQIAHLVSPVLVAGDADVKFTLPELPGGLGHLIQGPGLVGGRQGAGDDGDQKHHHSREEKDGCGRGPHLV